jgi:hypothetical protein
MTKLVVFFNEPFVSYVDQNRIVPALRNNHRFSRQEVYLAQSIVQKVFIKHIKSFYCRIKDNIACSQKVVKRIMKIHVGQQPSDDLLWSLVRPSTESVLQRQSMKTTFRLSTEDTVSRYTSNVIFWFFKAIVLYTCVVLYIGISRMLFSILTASLTIH